MWQGGEIFNESGTLHIAFVLGDKLRTFASISDFFSFVWINTHQMYIFSAQLNSIYILATEDTGIFNIPIQMLFQFYS